MASTAFDPPTRPFRCSQCDRSFTRIDHLHRHKLSHVRYNKFICSRCRRAFVRLDVLQRHQTRIHGLDSSSQASSSTLQERRTLEGSQVGGLSTTRSSDLVSSNATRVNDTRGRRVRKAYRSPEPWEEDEALPLMQVPSGYCPELPPETRSSSPTDEDDLVLRASSSRSEGSTLHPEDEHRGCGGLGLTRRCIGPFSITSPIDAILNDPIISLLRHQMVDPELQKLCSRNVQWRDLASSPPESFSSQHILKSASQYGI
jgi:hypothetical protein